MDNGHLTKGLVSIIIPTWNRPESLRKTLESVFRQSYRKFEVIVVDDGSEIDISQAVKGYPIRTLIRQEHLGASVARNNGFAESRGEFLLFCDDDVELKTCFLEKMVEALKKNPKKAFAYCGFERDGEIAAMEPFDPKRLRKENYINTVSLIRRSEFPGFDPSLKRLQDWNLWLTMLEKNCEGVWVPELLFRTTRTNWPRISDDSSPGGWTYDHAYRVVVEKHIIPMIQSLETEKTTLADELTKVRDDLTQRESMIQSLETEKTRLTDELSCIRHSVGYKFMRFYGPKVDSIFPENTRRGEMKKIVATSLRVISDEGMRSFLSQALAKIRRREFRIVEPAPHYGKSEVELIPPS